LPRKNCHHRPGRGKPGHGREEQGEDDFLGEEEWTVENLERIFGEE